MKKILLTGAGGFVGSRILDMFKMRYDVVTFPHGMLRSSDEESIVGFAKEQNPDIIIHTAAIADMAIAEANPDESYRTNVLLTLWMARAAAGIESKLLCFSSDQVYNACGSLGPFGEAEVVSPSNVYGRHKLEAEERALAVYPQAVMLRATWMYDYMGYLLPVRDNLLLNLLRAEISNKSLMFSPSVYRGVTYVRQVVNLIEPSFDLPGGVYNFGSENDLNMVDTALAFLRALGLEDRAGRLILVDKESKSRSLRMDCGKLASFGIRFDKTAEGIKRCLKDYGLL